MPRYLTLILGAIAMLAAYFGIRSLMNGNDSVATVKAETVPTLDKPVAADRQARDGMAVAVRRSVAEVRPMFLSLSGRTEPARNVTVKAEAAGTITSAPAVEGKPVEKGALLCGLDIETKAARAREAEAEFTRRDLDWKTATDLAQKGWASETRVASAKAALDAARAALEVARIELAKTQLRAPFAGVFEKRMANVGEFLAPGAACGVVVQFDPIVVTAEADEKQAAQIKVDAAARLRLSDGGEAPGEVRYIARTADAQTRAFRVEVEVPNPTASIPVGRAAEVRIRFGEGPAHKVAPGLLTMDKQGRIGVRYLDVGGMVSFATADVVDEATDGVWITGLPNEALIVEEGQDSVTLGTRATPVIHDQAG